MKKKVVFVLTREGQTESVCVFIYHKGRKLKNGEIGKGAFFSIGNGNTLFFLSRRVKKEAIDKAGTTQYSTESGEVSFNHLHGEGPFSVDNPTYEVSGGHFCTLLCSCP